MWRQLPCSIYRGGTSKSIFFLEKDLPKDPVIRDRVMLSVIGDNKDNRINGLGGPTVNTSKVIIIDQDNLTDTDVAYTLGQVSLTEPVIDYSYNSGNIAFSVGLFALNKGMFTRDTNHATIRILNRNTNEQMSAHISNLDQNKNGAVSSIGEANVILDFMSPGGKVTGQLFPSNQLTDTVEVEGTAYTITIIDAGNLTVFVHATELGLEGIENEEATIKPALETINRISEAVGHLLGLSSTSLLKMIILGEAKSYLSLKSKKISNDELSLCARDITLGNLHPAFPVTGAIAVSIASLIPGTLAHRLAQNIQPKQGAVKIGHPSGIFEVGASVFEKENKWHTEKITLVDSAQAIIDGNVWVAEQLFSATNEKEKTYMS